MEHIFYSNITSQLEAFKSQLEAFNIFSPTPFSFCKDHSDELQLLQTVHDLGTSLNNRS